MIDQFGRRHKYGFHDADLRKHKTLIVEYMTELGSRGVLDDRQSKADIEGQDSDSDADADAKVIIDPGPFFDEPAAGPSCSSSDQVLALSGNSIVLEIGSRRSPENTVVKPSGSNRIKEDTEESSDSDVSMASDTGSFVTKEFGCTVKDDVTYPSSRGDPEHLGKQGTKFSTLNIGEARITKIENGTGHNAHAIRANTEINCKKADEATLPLEPLNSAKYSEEAFSTISPQYQEDFGICNEIRAAFEEEIEPQCLQFLKGFPPLDLHAREKLYLELCSRIWQNRAPSRSEEWFLGTRARMLHDRLNEYMVKDAPKRLDMLCGDFYQGLMTRCIKTAVSRSTVTVAEREDFNGIQRELNRLRQRRYTTGWYETHDKLHMTQADLVSDMFDLDEALALVIGDDKWSWWDIREDKFSKSGWSRVVICIDEEKNVIESHYSSASLRCGKCSSCRDEDQMVKLSCSHDICHQCVTSVFHRNFTTPPRCCTKDPISLKSVDHLFDRKSRKRLYRKYEELATEYPFYCPGIDCGHWIRPKYIKDYTFDVHEHFPDTWSRNVEQQYAECYKCGIGVCCGCNYLFRDKARWNVEHECPEAMFSAHRI